MTSMGTNALLAGEMLIVQFLTETAVCEPAACANQLETSLYVGSEGPCYR